MTDPVVWILAFSMAAVIVLGTGVWLTRSGWPFSPVLLTVHKLVALAAVIVLGILVYRSARATPVPSVSWVIIIAAALLSVASFASGGVVSAMQSAPVAVHWIHRVGSWVTAGSLAACLALVERAQ